MAVVVVAIAAKYQIVHKAHKKRLTVMLHAMQDQNQLAPNQHLSKAHHVAQVVVAVCS
jgi:hypothetical protein